jgi:hypothetical protein
MSAAPGPLDHSDCQARLGPENRAGWDMRCRHPGGIIGPGLWQIQGTIDEGMAMPRDIRSEHADLAIRNLAGRTGVLTTNAARGVALLEKAALIDHQNRVIGCQLLDNIVADNVAHRVRVPSATAQNGLLAPGAGVTSGLRAHPTGLAPFVAQYPVKKQTRRRCDPFLRKQRSDPRLHSTQRRRPKFQRRFDRSGSHP